MVAKRVDAGNGKRSAMPPAATPEGRENQMVSYAFDLAEKQLLDGTASAQVITHFLKFGTERERLEREKLRKENLLAQARVDQISSTAMNTELYQEVIYALKGYRGDDMEIPDDDYE